MAEDSQELPGDQITERTARAHLEQRVEALEAELERVSRARDIMRAELSYVRYRLGIFSRAVQLWVLLRGAIRHPSRLPGLARRVVRVLRSPLAPPQAPMLEAPAPSASELAAERRVAVARSFRDRVLAAAADRSVRDLRVAIVADDELVANLAPDCHLVPLRADDWRSRVEEERPDLLLVESAWRGSGGTWQYRVAWHGHPDSLEQGELRALVEWSRERDVPTAFWHTAAAHHTNRFRHSAVLFDHVAATSADAAAFYETAAERNAAAVSLARHAVQPRRHNPMARPAVASERGTAFVGSWDPALPLMRRELLEAALDGAVRHDLALYDRRLGAEPGGFAFPDRFRPQLAGWVPTDRLPGVYKQHRVVVDAWTDGGGSVPVRLLEALASGTPVVAASADEGPPPLLAEFLATAGDASALDAAIASLLDDEEARSRVLIAAPTAVYRHDTYAHRLAAIARELGHRVSAPRPSVSVVVLDDGTRRGVTASAMDAARQLGANEVVVGTTDWDAASRPPGSPPGDVAVRVIEQRSDVTDAERIRRLAAVAASEWIAVLGDRTGDEDVAGPLWAALNFADADVIGLATPAVGRPIGHGYVGAVAPDTVLIRREVALERGWPAASDAAVDLMRDWSARGVRFFAVPVGLPAVAAAR